jgi:hypothetical protein
LRLSCISNIITLIFTMNTSIIMVLRVLSFNESPQFSHSSWKISEGCFNSCHLSLCLCSHASDLIHFHMYTDANLIEWVQQHYLT